ncbi:MAG TPA: glycosyltransferase family 4 protein [Methylomirabilota bacterium]|nr:glycosyltransferase family 4 protein [Methylomirabilota bacterium]
MKVLQLMSCRGWSSDAYWAARISAELERAGHEVTLVCKRGSETRVMDRARDAGAHRIETLAFAAGLRPAADLADLRRLRSLLRAGDVVHVHRGKEHWLAALAVRAWRSPRPVVRTRHIVQPIRAHPLNRWLYRRGTDLVVTVTEAIRTQYVASGLMTPERVVALPGGVDAERFDPKTDGAGFRASLPVEADIPLVGLVSGFRVMKGHLIAVEALKRLAAEGRRFRAVFIGEGALEPIVSRAAATAGLEERIAFVGFTHDLPTAMAAFDVALYPPLESDGMSRVLFEYLAMGRAVVASRVGVVPEVLADGRSALLVPAGEPGPLAAAIGRLLADSALRAKLGATAAELARTRLSGACVARKLGELYATLMFEPSRGRRGSCEPHVAVRGERRSRKPRAE